MLHKTLQELKKMIPPAAKSWLKSIRHRAELRPSVLSEEQKLQWKEQGFLVLKSFFTQEEVKKVNQLVDELWSNRKNEPNLVIDVFLGRGERRIKFKDSPEEARLHPYKLNDLFLEHGLVRHMVAHSKLRAILSELLDGEPLICNGLSFERSSQQDYHFDTFYMPPPIQNKMCASWIALEDVSAKAGPLGYYPKSHKIPPYHFSHGQLHAIPGEMPQFYDYINQQLKQFNLKPVVFCPSAGDVFIWHAQLYHRGMPIEDMNLTRKSLVTHYFRAQDFNPKDVVKEKSGPCYLKRPHLI